MSRTKYVTRTLFSSVAVLVGLLLVLSLLTASTTDGDKLVTALPYETIGQKHWFATPSGTGDCTTWNHACTFRTAVAKCTSAVHDVIHLGEGVHDADNGGDANGTTIAVNGVTIEGMGSPGAANATLVNGYATAATVLKVTGDGFNLRTVNFDNTGQTDEDVIFLHINGSTGGSISNCHFMQAATASTGTGIQFDGSSTHYSLADLRFHDIEDYGIRTSGMTHLAARRLHFVKGGVGVSIAGASDGDFLFTDTEIEQMATGVSVTGASVTGINFTQVNFTHNTANISDGGAYDETHFQEANAAHSKIVTYPANAGISVDTGDGAWTWTASPTTIIAADAISNPFYIVGINVPVYDATQTFKVELLYGESVANTSLGIYEFTVGVAAQGIKLWVYHPDIANVAIPANAIVGAKLMSSTAGVDAVEITLSYQEL